MQVHAPTQQAPKKETEQFYELVQKSLQSEKEYYNIIMGDYNAKIGKGTNREGWYCIGKFGSGNTTNRNGEMLLNFAENNELKIANTYLKKKEKQEMDVDVP